MRKLELFKHLAIFLLFQHIVTAGVEHSGFVGGAFHGIIHDAENSVNLQLGPTADLTVANALVAHSQLGRILSGGNSTLHASVLLDDGTHMVLDPSEVEWTFSQPGLSVQNGSLLAEIFSERTMIRVQASAEGFSTSFTVFILADDGQVAQKEREILPDALRAAIELESEGWKESEWFGVFYDAKNGWLFHADHGWIHIVEGAQDATWFWNEQNQWVWTGKNIYPHLYRNRDAAWLYFFKQALPEKVFYNHQSEKLERFADR